MQLFLRLSKICLLILIILLICYSAFISSVVEGEKIKRFLWKHSNFYIPRPQVQPLGLAPGGYWPRSERGTMVTVLFSIVSLIVHCSFQLWKSMCGILSITCLVKTKSLLSLCQIKTQQEIKSSCKLGTHSQILGIIVRGVVRV